MQYFMLSPHNRFYTRFYAWALNLSFIYRISITFFLVIITGMVWFYGVYHPNELAINQFQLDIVALQNQRVTNIILHKECMQEQKKIEDLERNFLPYIGSSIGIVTTKPTTEPTTISADSSVIVPAEKMSMPSCLIDILSYLNKSGMKLTVGNRGNQLDKGWYIKQVMHINATGTLANIKDFFVQLYESKKMISSSAFEISRADNDLFNLSVDFSLFRPNCTSAAAEVK